MDVSHVSLRSGYTDLVERLNRFPQGAPPSPTPAGQTCGSF